MQAWVNLKTVQWAYAHQNANVCDINKEYRCSVVRPSEVRCSKTFTDKDREILMNFENEHYYTLFVLRWS